MTTHTIRPHENHPVTPELDRPADSSSHQLRAISASVIGNALEWFDFTVYAFLAAIMLPLPRKSKAARIVNLSSALGSLAMNGDPSSPYYSAQPVGYNASKAALHMLTVQLSEELCGAPHVVNSVSPGYVKTDLTGGNGFLTTEQGARTPVKFALLGDDAGPSPVAPSKADGNEVDHQLVARHLDGPSAEAGRPKCERPADSHDCAAGGSFSHR